MSATHGVQLTGTHSGSHEIEMPCEEMLELPAYFRTDSRRGRVAETSVEQGMIDDTTMQKGHIKTLRKMAPPTEDDEPKDETIAKVLDPRNSGHQLWRKVFTVTCLVAIFLDPLFFYVPVVNLDNLCVDIDRNLGITVTVLRTAIDCIYAVHIVLTYRTGFLASTLRASIVLVEDTKEIARRHMRVQFWWDLVVIMPLPQLVIWVFLPVLRAGKLPGTKTAVLFLVVFHYITRLFRMVSIVKNSGTVRSRSRNTGVFMESVLVGAFCNLLMYMLASHIIGACWYLLTVERQVTCWRKFCHDETGANCSSSYLSCRSVDDDKVGGHRAIWLDGTHIGSKCVASWSDPTSTPFNFGLYSLAVEKNITAASTDYGSKYFYCLLFGLNGLSTLGQGFKVSSYIWEMFFAIIIFMSGLLLIFALLLGNVQKYLSAVSFRLAEMQVKRRDTEEWMNQRKLPPLLRKRVRKYEQYKWVKTLGVDEPAILDSLPRTLRRDIKFHLCSEFVRRVPFFDRMDDQLLDAVCERLQPALHIENSYLMQEGDPVFEMSFIIRGNLEAFTTKGCRARTYPLNRLRGGDFCGEQLLPWALATPEAEMALPLATLTILTTTDVEAFSLSSGDLKFMASHFWKLHSKQLQHTLRYFSYEWRTRAATVIQATWRRNRQRKLDSVSEATLSL